MDLEPRLESRLEPRIVSSHSTDCPIGRNGIIISINYDNGFVEHFCTRWSASNKENPIYTFKDCLVRLLDYGYCEQKRNKRNI
jgi:hypothetical protein